jgi:hypothetical protein
MPCVCLANYGASEAFYLRIVVEKIHEYFRSKNAPISLVNKISCSLTFLALAYFGSLQCWIYFTAMWQEKTKEIIKVRCEKSINIYR